MKRILLSILFVFISINQMVAQGDSVATAQAFCAGGSQLVFPNIFGEPDPTSVGCLGSIPNPAYYYLTIDQPGDLIFSITQEDTGGNPIDVDFIAWGPFNSVAEADANITLTDCPACPNNTTDPTFYPYAPDNITDCSFDTAPNETFTITGATSGQIYVLLITNFNGAEGFITFQQSGGLGTTSCNGIPICGGEFTDSGGDTGNYNNNENDTTTVYPTIINGIVTLDFTTLDLDTGDVLAVYDGPDDSYPFLGNVSAGDSFTSSDISGALTFVFTSDGAGVASGWYANVSCRTRPLCGGLFLDSGGNSGDYANNELEIVTIFPDNTGEVVTVDFTTFNLDSGDILAVYNGPNNISPFLGNVTTAPSSYTSTDTSGALTFAFTSNNAGVAEGWEAAISCNIPPPICGGYFFDSGGPANDYNNNENTTTTITPDNPGEIVSVVFTAFNLESCCDELTIYDGPDATAPLIGTFTGTTLPGTFISTHASGTLTFVFTSDGSVNNPGWEAEVFCNQSFNCGDTFTDSGGNAGNYSNDESIVYNILPNAPNEAVVVDFTNLNLSAGDVLTVYDGPNTSSTSLGTVTTSPVTYTATDPSGILTFEFISNSNYTSDGWEATISCIVIPVCGNTFTDSGGTGGDYNNNELITNTFYPDTPGDIITVTFSSFSTESCCDDLLVYDGPDDTATLIGTYAGTTIPGPFTSTHPSGALTFVFDSDGSNVSSGWEAEISCSTPINCGDLFTDSGGNTGAYSNNESYIYSIVPSAPNETVVVDFSSLNLNPGDILSVYDGPNTSSPSLGTVTTSPSSYTSTHPSGILTFEFISDANGTADGWEATTSCTVVPICGSTFTDSGGSGGNYGTNELITNTFYPDTPGDIVTVTFSSFNTESCCDDLLVYDGPDNTAPLIGSYSGTTIPGPFTSTHPSGALTFVFDSDGSVVNSGWEASITCSNPCSGFSVTETVVPTGADSCSLNYVELTASGSASGSTVFEENFNGANFPAGWVINDGASSAEWIISNTTEAGGTANEAMLDWTTGSHTATWTLTSPAIDITRQTNLELSFLQNLDVFGSSTDISVYVETSLNNTNWTTQYSIINADDTISNETIDISALDGNTTLYLRFRLYGDTQDLFDWSIDNIEVTGVVTPQITWSPFTGLYTDPALTTPYAGGFTDTVYAAPNGTETYTATDSTCSDDATVTRSQKIWNGSVSDDWYTDANWTPVGVPTATDCVTIPDITIAANDDPIVVGGAPIPPLPAVARRLHVLDGGYLSLNPDSNLIITNTIDIEPNGLIFLEDSANLIQIDDVANTGNISMNRNAEIRQRDYVYWSSPVPGIDITNVSPNTANSLIWEWQPTVGGYFGNWFNTTETMITGKGYAVRGPSTFNNTAEQTYTANFLGVPNNGTITRTITRGTFNGADYAGPGDELVTSQDDNWNLIGNPYPSAISAIEFINANTNIEGAVYLWTHGNLPNDAIGSPFYDDFVYNYNINDYVSFNGTGSNPPGFSGNIGASQGFFVLMNELPTTQTETVTFNNTMRSNLYSNNDFYRSTDIERHRIWMDLIGPTGDTNTILVGYIEGATNNKDRVYDAILLRETAQKFYSISNTTDVSIQGRALPFTIDDQVPLGVDIPTEGSYTIALDQIDGLFEGTNQAIFIEDTYTNTIHNLRLSPYQFTAEIGEFKDRLILRYTDNSLSLESSELDDNISIYNIDNGVSIVSKTDIINDITIYDALGKLVFNIDNLKTQSQIINTNKLVNGAYIITIKTENNRTVTKKVIL